MQNIINEKQLRPNLYDTIERYPFNGKSKYLIDKFYVIGYDNDVCHKLLIEKRFKDLIEEKTEILIDSEVSEYLGNKKDNLYEPKSFFLTSNPPSLLNEISSDYKKEMPDFEIIKNMIFPNGSEFIYIMEDYKKEHFQNNGKNNSLRITTFSMKSEFMNDPNIIKKKLNEKKKSYYVVFSYNPQEGNNSKKSIYGFAFIFYKKYHEIKLIDDKVCTFYIPCTFCILSEYPFYNSYYNLCNQLCNLFKSKQLEIPLEIIIYNIVNYTPSPINSDVFIDFSDFNLFHGNLNSELVKISEELEIEIENEKEDNNLNNKIVDNNNQNNADIFNVKRVSNITEANLRLMSISTNPSFLSKKKKSQKIKFELLSGYPVIQYNLVKVLLNKMAPEDVIIIFFYTFLEKSVIFFSKDIELLSLTINSYLNLNFPLNDEKYYFYNASISYDNYMKGNSIFIGTTFTNIIGINSEYRKDYHNNHVRLSEHLTVDLDNGVINQEEDDKENDNEKRDSNIFDFFRQIFKDKQMKENEKNTILYREVHNIYHKLNSFKELFNKKNAKEAPNKYKKVIKGNYIDYDDHEEENNEKSNKTFIIKEANKEIQESFYKLINNLCLYFYHNLSLKSHEDVLNKKTPEKGEIMNTTFNDENIEKSNNYIQEEKDFLSELRETMKFQSFVYGFIQSYNPIDLYKIPLTFTEEFLSVIAAGSNNYNENKNKIDFLSLIDNLYKINKKGPIFIKFKGLFDIYYEAYKKIIDREIYDNNNNNDKIKMTLNDDYKRNINIEGIKYLSFELNNNIIFKYKYLIDDLNEKGNLNNENYIKNNEIQKIMINEIENSIENTLIKLNILTAEDICYSNIIILFVISMKNIIMKFDYHSFLSSLFHHCKVTRKYYAMIIEVIYKLMKENLEKKNYKQAEVYFMGYYPFINSLRSLGLIPNENLFNMIKKFHQVNFDDLKNQKENNNEDNKINDNCNQSTDENEEITLNHKYIYICKNFTKNNFIKEKKIMTLANQNIDENDENKKLILGKINKKIHKPKIKFNNGIINYECDIHSQKSLFKKLNNIYITYITVKLDDNFITVDEIFPICLNIIVYFRNIEYFNGKDEIEVALSQMLNLYSNMLIQRDNNK